MIPYAFQDPYHKWSHCCNSNVSPHTNFVKLFQVLGELKHFVPYFGLWRALVANSSNIKLSSLLYPALQPQLSMSFSSLDKGEDKA